MHERTRREALAALAGLAGLAGCTTGPGDPGTEQDGPPEQSPVDSVTRTPSPTDGGPTTPELVDTGEEAARWAVRLDGPVKHTPAIRDGTVFAATGWDGFGTPEPGSDETWSLAALAGGDGTPDWSLELSAPAFGSPVSAGGGVYLPTGFSNGMTGIRQRLLKAADGERRWRTDPGSGFHHLLAVDDDGRAYVGTSDDAIGTGGETLFAVDGEDGTRAWAAETGDAFGGRMVDAGLLVDVGGVVVDLYDAGDGTRRWRSELELLTEPDGTVPVVDGAVPVATPSGDAESFAALDLADGSVRWTFADAGEDPFVTTGATAVPEVKAGTSFDSLLVGTEYDGAVFALSPLDGGVLWRFEADGQTRDGAVADGERVYVGDLAGTVYAIDATDGSELWRADVGGPVGWLAVAGDTVVAERGKGAERLVGFARTDGSTRWTFQSDERLTRPAVGDGTVVVGSDAGLVRALGA
jgi:outer membrane protein assembly factor BamB